MPPVSPGTYAILPQSRSWNWLMKPCTPSVSTCPGSIRPLEVEGVGTAVWPAVQTVGETPPVVAEFNRVVLAHCGSLGPQYTDPG